MLIEEREHLQLIADIFDKSSAFDVGVAVVLWVFLAQISGKYCDLIDFKNANPQYFLTSSSLIRVYFPLWKKKIKFAAVCGKENVALTLKKHRMFITSSVPNILWKIVWLHKNDWNSRSAMPAKDMLRKLICLGRCS